MSTKRTEYDPFDDDMPRVQIPLGADEAGISIDGEFTPLYELPDDAYDAYVKYAKQGGNIRVYQCDRCGYLTDADAFSAMSYNRSYECGNCGGRLKGTTQHGSNTGYTQVHGPMIEHDDENRVDVNAVVAEQNCENDHGPSVVVEGRYKATEMDEEAIECDQCVPNHPSHLGRLQNDVGGEITQGEMMQRVAESVKEFREA